MKQPSDLSAIALELSKRQSDSSNTGSASAVSTFLQQITALAAAWGAEDLNLLKSQVIPQEIPEAAGFMALRERVEREIVSRWAEIPELNQAPAANLRFADAADAVLAKLASERQWPRALRLLEAQRALRDLHGAAAGPRNAETIFAVGAFLKGLSLEEAGLSTEAAAAYKSVLAAAVENTPVAEAVERLKALAREHPREVKAAPVLAAP